VERRTQPPATQISGFGSPKHPRYSFAGLEEGRRRPKRASGRSVGLADRSVLGYGRRAARLKAFSAAAASSGQ
jgi:hypothetical protein